jgi:hypothetical protein
MQSFILRMNPAGRDRVADALAANEIIIGWSEAEGLTNESRSRTDFREIIHRTYHAEKPTYIEAGLGAGNMWRFLRRMDFGDLVLVPNGPVFFLARITGPAYFDESRVAEDTAHRRPVEWLNNAEPISRYSVSAELQSRMRSQLTCIEATDLMVEIAALGVKYSNQARDFQALAPERIQVIERRVVRDTPLARRLKAMHGNRCQLCGAVLAGLDGWRYSEAHHVRPLGSPHNGPDTSENIVILCPNHHAMCDYGAILLDSAQLTHIPGHTIGPHFIEYHNRVLCRGVASHP